jgi:hypothetical protein
MANVIFAYQDLSLYNLSATATDSNFPLVNIQSYYPDQIWKSTSTGAQSVTIDFGAAKQCDFIVLDTYSWGNADSVILECANDSGFTSGLVTAIAGGIIYAGTSVTTDYYSFASQIRRYWRLRLTIASPPLANVPYIGNWFLGSKLDWGQTYSYPYKNTNRKYQTVETTALDGRLRMTQVYAGRPYWEFDMSNLSDAVKALFQTMYGVVRGKLRPFYFVDVDGATANLVHMDLDYDSTETRVFNVNDVKKLILKKQLLG